LRNLYVADSNNNTIRKVVVATGVVTTIVGVAGQAGVKLGPTPGGLNTPTDVAILPSGGFVIIDSAASSVLLAH
jgi:DNA-binding beta-propeller fold protein YncE